MQYLEFCILTELTLEPEATEDGLEPVGWN